MSSNSYSKLSNATASFNDMLRHFGVVTVMNAKVYDYAAVLKDWNNKDNLEEVKCDEVLAHLKQSYPSVDGEKFLCELKTLKIANVTLDGPSKTVTGGQYANPLIKFGKTATMEIQDALGNAEAIEALGGGLIEHFHEKPSGVHNNTGNSDVLHIGTDFASAKMILGDSFFIDQKTGQQVKVNIIFYQFLPDSLFNLTQDSEGDASVFDMNGSLLTTDILVGDDSYGTDGQVHGVFYSIVSPNLNGAVGNIYNIDDNYVITLADGYTGTLDNVTINDDHKTVTEHTAALLIIKDSSNKVVVNTTIVRP